VVRAALVGINLYHMWCIMSTNTKTTYSAHDVRMMFRGYVYTQQRVFTNGQIAMDLGIDSSVLSNILSGTRDVPARVADNLFGLTKVSYYVGLVKVSYYERDA